uniref:Uncharacterized protein n=1 Tax=Anguilla anguilla TaxID=7936 RepID=A0A0E9U692_ANGAN
MPICHKHYGPLKLGGGRVYKKVAVSSVYIGKPKCIFYQK